MVTVPKSQYKVKGILAECFSLLPKSLTQRTRSFWKACSEVHGHERVCAARRFNGGIIEMKTLIAASAIQITFGLPSVYFKRFYQILIYRDDYYSTITHHHHKGEVNTRGFIVLSWKNPVMGYINNTDGRNLKLHEMAHALRLLMPFAAKSRICSIIKYSFNSLIMHGLKWRWLTQVKFHFSGLYGHERPRIFAVAVENFWASARISTITIRNCLA